MFVDAHPRKSAGPRIGKVANARHCTSLRAEGNWAFDWDWRAAEAAFRRAIELDPSDSMVQLILAHLLSQTGRHAEAEPLMSRARELAPDVSHRGRQVGWLSH
jgi:Flp pilus assembly protein TadD